MQSRDASPTQRDESDDAEESAPGSVDHIFAELAANEDRAAAKESREADCARQIPATRDADAESDEAEDDEPEGGDDPRLISVSRIFDQLADRATPSDPAPASSTDRDSTAEGAASRASEPGAAESSANDRG